MSKEVRASHILLAYDGATRSEATRSKQEAQSEITDLKAKLEGGSSFEDLARDHSDCNSRWQGGDLGTFAQGQTVKEFEDVAFALDVGATSDVVESPFGYHLIRRTA